MSCFAYNEINQGLLSFIDHSPNSYFAVENMRQILLDNGYRELTEENHWEIEAGGSYFVTRNESALIAFKIPEGQSRGFHVMASHCDSPSFKVKINPEMEKAGLYVVLNTEPYGGMIVSPWLDRPLSVAGRVLVSGEDGKSVESRLVNVDQDLLMIPNLAIHMNREMNSGYQYNAQTELLPLLGEIDAKDTFMNLIAEEAGVSAEDILDFDLFLYNRMKGTMYGIDRPFIASGRLDDLQCAYASLQGLLASQPQDHIAVHCVLDNEEVGSGSRQGAAGTFLKDVINRIAYSFGYDHEKLLRSLSESFIVSADNAHAVHPFHTDKADPTNAPKLNGGIVIKYNAGLKYTTDGLSGAKFRLICQRAGVPYQTYTNRSDHAGGSTLGHILQSQLSVCCVDIGLPQLAMHSPYETAGAKDTAYLIAAAKELFNM